ncbi:MAG: fatty acid desaturase family protein [Cytophagaceae bacterium]
MKDFVSVNDPVFVQPEKYGFFDKLFLNLIRDERDLPFIYLSLKITFFMILPGIALFFPLPGYIWWPLAIFYFYLNNLVFKGSFGLMLHCTSHRPFFKQKVGFMNHYLPWFVGPFFGQTPETYFVHHLGMHHVENNLEDDLSSTMHYQRDSFKDFMKYFLSFVSTGLLDTAKYFNIRQNNRFRNKLLFGEILYIVVCVVLFYFNPAATFMVFVLPYLISRFIMMLGNWTQHSFVDYTDPGNCYKNSINCINTSYNNKCWNDGYHINHHIRPSLHWTEYPIHFLENLDEFSKNKALIFDGIHYLHVWFYLMNKNYKKLAQHLVNIHGTFSSEEEAIELMQSRTKKMEIRGITMRSLKKSGSVSVAT